MDATSKSTATPTSEILLEPLNQLHKLSQSLFISLSSSQAKRPNAPSLESFLQIDASLADALRLAREHQINQRRIEELKNEVLSLDSDIRNVCSELEKGKRELEEIIQEGDERIAAIAKAKEASLPYPELLAYAQSLSAFTSAPPNMPDLSQTGGPPPPLFFPPFPNEEKMRRGHLSQEEPLGLLGETHSVGQAPTVSPTKVEQEDIPYSHANLYRHDQRPHQTVFDLDLDLNPEL